MNWNVWRPFVLGVLLVLGVGGCGPEEADAPPDMTAYFERFERLERTARGSSDGIYAGTYVVEGDLLLSDYREFVAYYKSKYGNLGIRNSEAEFAARSDGLTINLLSGVRDVWASEKTQNLTYCVSTRFEKEYGRGSYDTVVAAMEQATAEWSQAAAVRFRRVDRGDDDCDPEKGGTDNQSVLFAVEPGTCEGLDALAFFPSDDVKRRRLCINWKELQDFIQLDTLAHETDSRTVMGTLLHELGHILGFRHEQVAHSQWNNEKNDLGKPINTRDVDWSPLTKHDECSVMYYREAAKSVHRIWCGDYKLTALDRKGAADVYGAPSP